MNKKTLLTYFLGLVSGAVLYYGVGFLHQEEEEAPHPEEEMVFAIAATEEQKEKGQFVSTEVKEGSVKSVETVQGLIEVHPDRLIHLIAPSDGVVAISKKHVGDKVSAGEVLAVIESKQLAEAVTSFLEAERNYQLLATKLEKEKALFAKNIGSELDLMNLEAEYQGAYQNYRMMKEKLKLFHATEEDAKNQDRSLLSLHIKSPIQGTILARHMSVGESILTSDELFKIGDLTNLRVKLGVPYRLAKELKAGQSVKIEDFAGNEGHAVIDRILPELESETGHLIVFASLPNPHGVWKPGTFVAAEIELSEKKGILAVPKKAIVEINDEPYVFIENENGYTARKVIIDCQDRDVCLIKEGVLPQEKVVFENAERLKFELTKRDGEHE